MKIILAVFLCGLLFAAKAEEPAETEYEDPEDDLNDITAELDLYDEDDKPTNMEVALEGLTHCLSNDHGQVKRHCIKKFLKMLPKEIPKEKRKELGDCIVKGLKNCRKRPQHHEFIGCLKEAAKCVYDEEGMEGSGRWI